MSVVICYESLAARSTAGIAHSTCDALAQACRCLNRGSIAGNRSLRPCCGIVGDDLHLLAGLHLLAVVEAVEHTEPAFLAICHRHTAGQGLDRVARIRRDDANALRLV